MLGVLRGGGGKDVMAMVVVDGEKAKLGLVAFVKDWESHQSTHPPQVHT